MGGSAASSHVLLGGAATPVGKLLAAVMSEFVPLLRKGQGAGHHEGAGGATQAVSAAMIDRRLDGERAEMHPRGLAHAKPGSLLRSQIPVRTSAEWDDAVPGFMEIDLMVFIAAVSNYGRLQGFASSGPGRPGQLLPE